MRRTRGCALLDTIFKTERRKGVERMPTLRMRRRRSLCRRMTLMCAIDRGRFSLQDDMRPQFVAQKLLSKSTMNAHGAV
jgi:hypothetical protein